MKLQHITKTSFTIPGIGETDDNGVIDVTDEQAGRPPDPRVEEVAALKKAAMEASDHELTRSLTNEYIGLDKGTGLLAQDVWQPYGPKAKAALKSEGDSKDVD